MKEYGNDPKVTKAMEMFSYRVTKAVGAYLSALGGADAIVFGGGIGENTPLVRERVCSSLRWCGLEMDPEKNRTLMDIEGKLSTGTHDASQEIGDVGHPFRVGARGRVESGFISSCDRGPDRSEGPNWRCRF